MTPLVFCRFQPPQLLQPSQHICPAGRQQIELNLNSAIGMDDHFVQQISAEQLIVGVCFGDHLKMGLNVVCEIPNIIFQRVQVAQCFKLFFQRLDLLIICCIHKANIILGDYLREECVQHFPLHALQLPDRFFYFVLGFSEGDFTIFSKVSSLRLKGVSLVILIGGNAAITCYHYHMCTSGVFRVAVAARWIGG